MSLFHIISSIWVVISITLLFFSWRMAIAGKTTPHRNLMIFLTSGAWVFIASYLIQRPYSPDISLPGEYIFWLAFHGTIGLIPLVGATCLVVSRIRAKNNNSSKSHLNRHHKLYGGVVIALWLFSHLGGIFNIFLLNGERNGIIKSNQYVGGNVQEKHREKQRVAVHWCDA